jgi:hypothetical protein
MSGYTADMIESQGMLEEGIRLIQKPFSVENLAKEVQNSLNVDRIH